MIIMLKIFTENRKAAFNYQILEKFQAGLVLLGTEVKSIRLGRATLAGSYVIPHQSGLCLIGCHIPPYQPKNTPANYLPERSRPLLLKKKEILYLQGRAAERGLTLLPLKLYTNGDKLKLEFALVKPLKKFDKREKIKAKEFKREKQQWVAD